jgi:hypothetical protein
MTAREGWGVLAALNTARRRAVASEHGFQYQKRDAVTSGYLDPKL